MINRIESFLEIYKDCRTKFTTINSFKDFFDNMTKSLFSLIIETETKLRREQYLRTVKKSHQALVHI